MFKFIKIIVLLLISITIGLLVSILGLIVTMKLFNINNHIASITIAVIFGHLGAIIGDKLYKRIG